MSLQPNCKHKTRSWNLDGNPRSGSVRCDHLVLGTENETRIRSVAVLVAEEF